MKNKNETKRELGYPSPLYLLVVTLISVFLAELLVLFLLVGLPTFSLTTGVLLDALLPTALIFPILYIFLFRPLIRTITERRDMEKKLLNAAEEWRTTFDSITDLVSIHDKDYKITRVNMAFANAFKMKPQEVLGKKCYEMIHGIDAPHGGCPYERVKKDKKTAIEEFFEPHLDMYLEVTTSPILNEKNEIVRVVHIAKDITQRKEMERNLLEAEKMAAMGQFVSGAVHELNNPLAGIIGFSQAVFAELKKWRVNRKRLKKDMEVILNNANRCKDIITSLLTYGKTGFKFEFAPADIDKIVEESFSLVEYQRGLKDIKIVKEYSKDLPKVMVDKKQLSRVFENIIRNSYQSMEGEGTLKVETEEEGGFINVVFKDTGKGIKKEDLSRVFDPFFSTREVGEGTGLGLSISAGIIKTHKGRILVQSEGEGKGATFTVMLPMVQK